jgi:hypothetical protein
MDRPTVMTFPTLDQAESALDWIGIELVEADAGFEGELAADDLELLDEALGDAETPGPVRALAVALRDLLEASPDGAAWRVAYTA